MKNQVKYILFYLTFLFPLHSFSQKTDSLKTKRIRFNLVFGTGINNTFMGYPRISKPTANPDATFSRTEIEKYSNENSLLLLPIGEAGFNLKVKTKKRDIYHNFYLLGQFYKTQYHYSYFFDGHNIDQETVLTEEISYSNQTINLKFGYGVEFDFEYFYITPQFWYSIEIQRNSTLMGYINKDVYTLYNNNPPIINSSEYTNKDNTSIKTNSYYRNMVLGLEIGKNLNGRISRFYVKSGIGLQYTEKVYSIGININLF